MFRRGQRQGRRGYHECESGGLGGRKGKEKRVGRRRRRRSVDRRLCVWDVPHAVGGLFETLDRAVQNLYNLVDLPRGQLGP
jgi:hypothetical protein